MMSRIDDLIARLCPHGVGFYRLDELGVTYAGLSGKTKADFSGGNARFVTYMNVYSNLAVDLRARDFVRITEGEKQNTVRRGDVLFTGSSETLDDVGMSSVVLEQPGEPVYLNSFCFGYRLNKPTMMLPGFSKYVFRSKSVRRDIAKVSSGVTRFNISKARFLGVRIPVPPLEVQRAIVKLLDNFMALEMELELKLEAELEARGQQYHYYRDALIGFAQPTGKEARLVPWKALGEVGTFTRGRRFTNKDFVPSGVGCIHYGEVYTHYGLAADTTKSFVRPELAARLRMARKGDLVIAGTGENVEEIGKAVAWLGENPVAVHDDCYIFSHSLHPKYAAHLFRSGSFRSQKVRFAAGAKMIRITAEGLGRIRIPVPTDEEQLRIVVILDRFDRLVHDLSCSLPAELKARRQQYEHYRDQLLSFKEAV
jgi:type I restriction enzyme S subunit